MAKMTGKEELPYPIGTVLETKDGTLMELVTEAEYIRYANSVGEKIRTSPKGLYGRDVNKRHVHPFGASGYTSWEHEMETRDWKIAQDYMRKQLLNEEATEWLE